MFTAKYISPSGGVKLSIFNGRSTLGAIVILAILMIASGISYLTDIGTKLLTVFGGIFLIFVLMALFRNIRAF
jgi:hypothetical protein